MATDRAALVARITANIDGLKAQLANAGVAISTTTKSMEKLASSLKGDGIISQGAKITATIQAIGGASELTAKQAQKMIGPLTEAMAKLRATGQQIPADMARVHAELTKVAGVSQKSGGLFDHMFAKMAAAFSVGSLIDKGISGLVSLATNAFEAADHIGDLSTKMGVSAEAAQRFERAAKLSGATIEDVSTAIVKMSQNLVVGDKSTVAALKAVGLTVDQLRAKKPEDAFRTIMDAVASIPDAMKQAQVMMELFGKNGGNLLTMMRDGALAAADGIKVMTNETVRRLKDAKDAWKSFWDDITVISAEAIANSGLTNAPSDLAAGVNFILRSAKNNPVTALAQALADYLKAHPVVTKKDINLPLVKPTTTTEDAEIEAAIKKRAEAVKALEERYVSFKGKFPGYLTPQEIEQMQFEARFAKEDPMGMALAKRVSIYTALNMGQKQYNDLLKAAPLPPDIFKVGSQAELMQMLDAQKNQRLLTGGQPTLEAAPKAVKDYSAAVAFAAQITGTFSNIAKGAWGSIIAGAGKAIDIIGEYAAATNKAAASASAMWATITLGASLAINAVVNQIQKHKQLREDIIATKDELVKMGESSDYQLRRGREQYSQDLAKLGTQLDDAKARVAQVDIQIGKLSQATQNFGGIAPAAMRPFINSLLESSRLTEQQRALLQGFAAEPSWQQLEDTANKYGIALEGLGAKFQQTKLGELADQYFTDFTNLVDAGADANAVLAGMQDEVQALLDNAMKFGSALPSFMKPMLEQMAKLGLLTDEAGNSLQDLSRFNFTDSIESSFQRMADILEQIRDLLAVGIPNSALFTQGAARRVADAFSGITPGVLTTQPVGGGYIQPTTQTNVTINAIDSQSVEDWMRRGGDRAIARGLAGLNGDALGYA